MLVKPLLQTASRRLLLGLVVGLAARDGQWLLNIGGFVVGIEHRKLPLLGEELVLPGRLRLLHSPGEWFIRGGKGGCFQVIGVVGGQL